MPLTITQKNNIINQITALLAQLVETEPSESATAPIQASSTPPVMLTFKECAELVEGLSEHTVRMLCAQDKITAIRTGAGKNGKILVSKASLLRYLGISE